MWIRKQLLESLTVSIRDLRESVAKLRADVDRLRHGSSASSAVGTVQHAAGASHAWTPGAGQPAPAKKPATKNAKPAKKGPKKSAPEES
jgi:hypothetical protein